MKKLIKKILLICIAILLVCFSVPHIYTSQVLTEKNMSLFTECIDLFETIPSLEKIKRGKIITNQKKYYIERDCKNIEDFSPLENKKICKIILELEKSKFFKVEKHGNFILFFTFKHPCSSRKYGVCYSDDDIDPNEGSNEIAYRYYPYIKVQDNWYISSALAPQLRLPLMNFEVPESSIIDHSTKIPED